LTDFYILTNKPWTGRTLEIQTDCPEVIPVFVEAWDALPDYVRESIAYSIPYGGVIIRFSDLTHMRAAGSCGSDVIRISSEYLAKGIINTRAELINTIQHELTHFYYGHPTNDQPYVKNELEARMALIEWDLANNADHQYIGSIDRVLTMARRINEAPENIRQPLLDLLRDELKPVFNEGPGSIDYILGYAPSQLNNGKK